MLEEDLDQPASRRDLRALERRMKRHFDTVAEQFKSEFKMLYDWTMANTTSLDKRVEALETGHGARLTDIETRLLGVELDGRKKTPTKRR